MGKILKLLREFKLNLHKRAYNLLNTSKFEDRWKQNLLFIKKFNGKKSDHFEEYKKLFTDESSSVGNLNLMGGYISEINPLKESSEKSAGYDVKKGICNPLCSFIAFAKLENKKDFDEIMALLPNTERKSEFYSRLSQQAFDKQAFLDFLENNQKDSWEQDVLLFLTMMVENFSIFSIQIHAKRDFFHDLPIKEDILFNFDIPKYSSDRQMKFDIKALKKGLEKVDVGDYLQFNCGVMDVAGHTLLINKVADNKYLFFDPNFGAIGFDEKGNPNLTLEQLVEVMETALTGYIEYISKMQGNQQKNTQVYTSCSNITKILNKSIEFCKEPNRDTPDSTLMGLKIENAVSDEKEMITKL